MAYLDYIWTFLVLCEASREIAFCVAGYTEKKNSFDGGSEVMSRVRRGVLSLRVVRQMLPWPHKSYACGNDKLYSPIRYR